MAGEPSPGAPESPPLEKFLPTPLQKGFRSRLRRAENMVDIKVLLVFAQYPSEKFSAGVYCPQYMYNQFGNFSVWIFSRPGNQKRNWQQRAISLVMGLVCIANIGVRAGWG